MKVLVCGGRNFRDRVHLTETLDWLHADRGPITLVIHGAATGADQLSGVWARLNNVPVREYPAKWREHGRSAGPIRNAQMLKEGQPDLVVAFDGGTGTADMVSKARAKGVEVIDKRR